MDYKELCTAITNLADSTVPDSIFVSGLKQRLDETMNSNQYTKNVVWLIDVMATGSFPSGSEATQIKIGIGTKYNKQDLSQNEATKIGDCQDLAYAFIRGAYRNFSLIGSVNGYNIAVAYEGLMFTEFVGVIITLNVASKLPCWDFN
jgi:hypothetical protein